MLFFTTAGMYWSKADPQEEIVSGIHCLRFESKDTLVIMPRQDGAMVTRPMKESTGTPLMVYIPKSGVTLIQDVNDTLKQRFSAALAGIALPGTDAAVN